MNMRAIGLTLLVLCVLGGVIAALFSPALAATLTLPATPVVGQVVTPAAGRPVTPAPTTAQPATGVTPQPTQLPSGMTVLARDTFQRPDQALWGQASDGQIWGGDANTNPAFTIAHQAGQISNGQGAVQAIMNVASADIEMLFSGTVSQFAADGATNLGGVLRWQDNNNWYKILIDGNKLQLLKRVNGKTTILATQTFSAVGGTAYSIRFRALGSNLFAKVWPSAQAEPAIWTITIIDTDLKNGSSGIRVVLKADTIIRITSFVETNVVNGA